MAVKPGNHPENQAAIDLIDSWFSEPDNMGDEFWTEYEEELEYA